jgi:hypothetical protein
MRIERSGAKGCMIVFVINGHLVRPIRTHGPEQGRDEEKVYVHPAF